MEVAKLLIAKLLIAKLLIAKLLIAKLLIAKLLIAKLLIAKLLIASGADCNHQKPDGWAPIYSASSNGRVEMVRLLLHCGANPTLLLRSRDTTWTLAKRNGHTEVMSL